MPAFIEAQDSASQDATVVTAGLQAALDTGKVVFMPIGTYRTNTPLIISRSCRGFLGEIYGDGDGTRIDYHGTDAAIKLSDTVSGTRRVTQARVENVAIRVQNAGVNGIDFTDDAGGVGAGELRAVVEVGLEAVIVRRVMAGG